jgi:HK97 family phage major capsid protein
MPAKTLKKMVEEIKEKSEEMAQVFAEAGPDLDFDKVTTLKGDDIKSNEDKVKWVQEREQELADLNTAMAERLALEKTRDHSSELISVLGLLDQPTNMIAAAVEAAKGDKSATPGFWESFTKAYKPEMKDSEFELDIDAKTLFETTAGWEPETTRTGRVVDAVTRPIQITQVIPTSPTNQSAIVFMEETTYSPAAAETAEGGTFPEAQFELTERTSNVRKITHFVPATDEQLEDEASAGGYLDRRMRFGVEQRLDLQIVQGDGNAPNLDGLMAFSGIQTYALAGEPALDAIHKGITLVNVTGRAVASAILIHSNDWQAIRLVRTADGIYILGPPTEVGPLTLWGLPVVVNEVMTENTAIVGDYANFIELRIKRGVTVKVSDSHDDFFIKGKQAIRADMRVALPIYRAAAFCTVTGI